MLTPTLADCEDGVKVLVGEIEKAIGFNIEHEVQTGRGCFPGFKLTDDIKQQFQKALTELGEGQLGKCFQILGETSNHLKGKQVAFLRRVVLPKLHKLPLGLAEIYVKNDEIEPIRILVRDFDRKYEVGLIDPEQASEDYWAIVDRCKAVEERKLAQTAALQRFADEQVRLADERRKERCRELANALGSRFNLNAIGA